MRKSHKSQVTSHKCKTRIGILLLFILLVSCALVLLCSYSYATVSSSELIERARELDGRIVTYQGEAITAILGRGEYSWVNLNDGNNAIGIWCKSSKLVAVKFMGDYKHKGDIVEVEGTFNRACPLHGGELDIHAGSVRVVKAGFPVGEGIDKKKLYFSVLLFTFSLILMIAFKKRI